MKKIFFSFLIVLAVLAFVPVISHADPVSVDAPTLMNPLKNAPDLNTLILSIFDIVVTAGYIVVAFFLVWSGFKFVFAQGNESKLDDAKHTFYYTIIGAAIVIGAKTIAVIVQNLITSLSK